MGDPRRSRKKYKKPKKLWGKTRIEEDKTLKKEYGLRATKEIWIAADELRKVRREARKLLALGEVERKTKEQTILNKLKRLNINAKTLDDVLSLTVKDFLERRLQTIVYRKNLSRTISQARQLISHGFISVDGVKQTAPSRLLTQEEEQKIKYYKEIKLEKQVQENAQEQKEQKQGESPKIKEGQNQTENKGEKK